MKLRFYPRSLQSRVMSAVAAFFDLDGTLLSTSSAILYVKYLRRRPKGAGPFDRMPLSALLKTLWYQVLYNVDRIDIERVAEESVRPLAGHPERAMIELCEQWFEESVAAFIRPEMPALIAAHRRAGHAICVLTASTPYVTVPLCERLGIEEWIASRLEVAEGIFTGNIVRPLCYGAGKITHARAWAAPRNVEIEKSFFYTDSITDLPMCEAVGTPILVSPDRKLRREGRRRGWRILDLRGDSAFAAPDLVAPSGAE